MMQLDLISLLPGQKQMEKHREVIMHKKAPQTKIKSVIFQKLHKEINLHN